MLAKIHNNPVAVGVEKVWQIDSALIARLVTKVPEGVLSWKASLSNCLLLLDDSFKARELDLVNRRRKPEAGADSEVVRCNANRLRCDAWNDDERNDKRGEEETWGEVFSDMTTPAPGRYPKDNQKSNNPGNISARRAPNVQTTCGVQRHRSRGEQPCGESGKYVWNHAWAFSTTYRYSSHSGSLAKIQR